MAFEHGVDVRVRLVPLRMLALVQNLCRQRFKLRPELRRMPHLIQPVDQHVAQRIKLYLYFGAQAHVGAAPRSSVTR